MKVLEEYVKPKRKKQIENKDDVYAMCDDMLKELEDIDALLGKQSIRSRKTHNKDQED
jgi:hypothetical protein